LALLLLALLVLAACGDDASTSDDEEEPSGPPITDITDLGVEGEFSESATVEVGGGFETESSASRVVIEGSGAPVQPDQAVRLDFAIFNATTGEAGTSTYEAQAQNLILSPLAVIPPFVDALNGVPAGSRIVLAVPPADAGEGATQTETAIFVLDVEESFAGRATGTPETPPAGLPTVALGDLGKPTITIPATEAPAELLVQPLITGAGPPVTAGQTATVMYTGLKWDGTQFDSSWDMLTPRDFPIGSGGVIPGWDVALVDRPVGSQILMVVPPAQGYGEAGNAQAGISGTDTLVFVVDILAAR